MKRLLAPRPSTEIPYTTTPADGNVEQADASENKDKKGVVHLLKNHTLDDIARLVISDPPIQTLDVEKFLLDGIPPDDVWRKSAMAEWLLKHREPAVFLFLLNLGPISINLDNERGASTLLHIARSGEPVSGLGIRVSSSEQHAVNGQTLSLLIEAIKVNDGLDTWDIAGSEYCRHGLSPLLDALGCVKNLKFGTTFSELTPDDFMLVASLVSNNRNIKALNLGCHVPDLLQGSCPLLAPLKLLLAGLKAQNRLEQLCLAGVPRECQALLGAFIGASHALTCLDISLHGTDATALLIAGLRQNTSLQSLTLAVDSIDDGVLPLLSLLAEKKSSLERVVLETRNGREDTNDSVFIGNMIAINATMSSFTWRFRDHIHVDLVRLGAALGINSTLETIVLEKQNCSFSVMSLSPDWLDESQLPTLVEYLGKNRTLTKFHFLHRYFPFAKGQTVPQIEEIMDRNLSYQRHACSAGFMEGAARGFFSVLNMPSELGQPTVQYLLQHKPRIEAAALALVNKATHAWAREGRREESVELVSEALAIDQINISDATDRMIALLKRIVVLPQDFSDEALLEIACNPFMLDGLDSIMESNPQDCAWLVVRFGEVIGVGLIQTLIETRIRQRQHTAATLDI